MFEAAEKAISEVMVDETRNRFENQKFPDTVTPFYLGRMHDESSLGRYVLGVSPQSLPLRIKSLEVRPQSFQDIEFHGSLTDGQPVSATCRHVFHTSFVAEEGITAFHMNYMFYDIWGRTVGEYSYTHIKDKKGPGFDVLDSIAYGYTTSGHMILAKKSDSWIEDLRPANFHICMMGVSAVRTLDGAIRKLAMDEYTDFMDWAIPGWKEAG